jgi:hypothetical protein
MRKIVQPSFQLSFPQAFTHLALVSAAFNLDRVKGGGRPG